ncbi:MAG: YdcH family protein [Pseudomonadota bacterium]
MSHTPHELMEEFPDKTDAMHRLKGGDAHFARMFDDYHTVNRAIHRAETNIEPTDDLHMAEMRKERMALKDKIAAILRDV